MTFLLSILALLTACGSRFNTAQVSSTDTFHKEPPPADPGALDGVLPKGAPVIRFLKNNFSFAKGSSVKSFRPENSGGAITECLVQPSLPNGMNLDKNTCAISGSPATGQEKASYRIVAKNDVGADSVDIEIAVHSCQVTFSKSQWTTSENVSVGTRSTAMKEISYSCDGLAYKTMAFTNHPGFSIGAFTQGQHICTLVGLPTLAGEQQITCDLPNPVTLNITAGSTPPPTPPVIEIPTITRVFPRDEKAVVYFNSSLIGTAQFAVRSSCGQSVTGAKSPIIISNMQNGLPCVVTMIARTANGDSASSNSVNVLPKPPRYFGFYNYYQEGGSGLSAEQAFQASLAIPNTNFVFLHSNDADIFRHLEQVKLSSKQAIIVIANWVYQPKLHHSKPNFWYLDTTTILESPTDFQTLWTREYKNTGKGLLEHLAPYRDSIAAFYDEEAYWGSSYNVPNNGDISDTLIANEFRKVSSTLKQYSSFLKTNFPEIPILLMEEGLTLTGQFFRDPSLTVLRSCPSCLNEIKIPDEIDWVGLEGEYPKTYTGPNSFGNWFGRSVPQYMAALKRFGQNKKLVIAPPAFLRLTESADELKKVVEQYLSLVDDKMVAVMPYFWFDPSTNLGLSSQANPILRNLYSSFGQTFLNNQTLLSFSIPAGHFRQGPTMLYSNGQFGYCAYDRWDAYIASGGNPDTSNLVDFEVISPSMHHHGICQ